MGRPHCPDRLTVEALLQVHDSREILKMAREGRIAMTSARASDVLGYVFHRRDGGQSTRRRIER